MTDTVETKKTTRTPRAKPVVEKEAPVVPVVPAATEVAQEVTPQTQAVPAGLIKTVTGALVWRG